MLVLLGGLAFAAKAQTVIGSWQSAPIPPSPANDEGWQRGQGGFGANGSIFASSNYPAYFELKTNVAAGYGQSLDIHETGYGSVRLYISLSAAQIAAFTNNSQLNFTLSVQPGDINTASGYIQQVDFQYNSSGGFHNGAPSTARGWSETGNTNNNSSGQPIFYYYTTAPARQQVVTWNYSSVLTNIVGSGYLQFVWVFQTSGGELTNIYINNVTLSGGAVPPIIVDQFNPTNNPYGGTNIYAVYDEITNVYNLWTGYGGNTAVDPTNIIWDSTQNCTNTPNADANSGALKLIANFTGANQFVIWNRGPGNSLAMNPPITNGYGLLTFEFDVKYDPSSQTWNNGGVTNFGNLEWGVVPSYTLAVLGSVQVPATNTGWVHEIISLTNLVSSDSDLLNITGIFFKQYAGYGNLTGQSILWLDNLKFTYRNETIILPPTVAIQKAVPALRIFAGSTANTYDREELATVDGNQSWVGGSYPVSYSFTLLSYPNNNINQTHIFLVPAATAGQNMYANQFIEYQATNMLWLVLAPNGAGRVTASVQWKTNQPNANATDTVVQFTNSTAIGTWTLAFNSATTGTLTAPGASPVAFSLPADVAALFANPVTAYFGLQPNSTAGEGLYEDWASITVTGVAGTQENEDFTKESSDIDPNTYYTPSGQFRSDSSALRAGVIIVRTNLDLYWVNWTLPAVNFELGTKTNLLQTGSWINPEYYSGYFDETAPRGAPVKLGTKNWVLLPTDDLPTMNGLPGGVLAPTAFFLVATNVLSP
jgi:hypothetical protein